MKFYNRKYELKLLDEIYKKAQKISQLTVIIGRRRVGKTELISHWLKGRERSVYFFVERKRTATILEEFTSILQSQFPFLVTPFRNWDEFWKFLFEVSKQESLTVVIDEFQNFKYIDAANFSILQKHWDKNFRDSKLNLILIGSIITLMEKIFRNNKEPLFGRVNHKMYLEPFLFSDAAAILKDHKIHSFEDWINFYAVFGGVPKYYRDIENENGLRSAGILDTIETMFLVENAPLRLEGYDLLANEFGKNYQTYFSLLQVIAGGSSKMSEIATKTGIPVTALSRYLAHLLDYYKIIERRSPLFSLKSKNNRYYVKDPLLTFWFRYIFKHRTLLEIKQIDKLMGFIKKDINVLKGIVFEKVVKEILIEENEKNNFIFSFDNIGRWWDKRNNEIDIVAYSKEGKKIFFGECKLSPREINTNLTERLKNKAGFVKWNKQSRQEYFGVFTVGKVDERVKKNLEKQGIIVKEF